MNFYFKIPARYKNETNYLIKITLCSGPLLWHFEGAGAVALLALY